MATRAKLAVATYLLLLALSALGAYLAAGFDAPYGPLVELEAVLHSILGGLYLAPLFAAAALGRRGLRLGTKIAALAIVLTALLYPLRAALYSGYVETGTRDFLLYVANAPVVFALTLAMGAFALLYFPRVLLDHLLARG